MAYEKKTWKDRQVQYPNRKTITNIDSGESITADVIRDEGIVTTEGDLLNAANLNDLENRIEQGIASSSGGGGSDVAVTQLLDHGTRIAKIRVDANTVSLYAPEQTEVSVEATQTSGTKIASVTVDNNKTNIYAKQTSITPVLTTGTRIAKVNADGVVYSLYAPQGGGGGGGEVIEALYQVSERVSEYSYHENYHLVMITVPENPDDNRSTSRISTDSSNSGSDSSGSGSGYTARYKSTLVVADYYIEYNPIWIFLSTFDEDSTWDIYYNYGYNEKDYYEDKDIVYHGSGYVTNKLIYVPSFCNFQIHYTAGDHIPRPEVRSPASHAPR